MKKYFLLMLLCGQLAWAPKTYSQNIAINATGSLPDTSAMLDVSSANKGLLAPRMSTAQQNAIPLPATGLLVFNTTTTTFNVNVGTPAAPVWTALLTNAGAGWSTVGNAGVNSGNQFLGSTNKASLRFRTNNIESMVLDSIGNVGIGVTNPATQLVVNNNVEIRRTGAMSQLLFTNTSGSGDFRLAGDGGDFYWQGGGGRALQMGSYWPTILGGDRQSSIFPTIVNGAGGTGVLVAAQRDASVALGIQANSASQSANLTEWRNSGGTVLSTMDKLGQLGIGTAIPKSTLEVNGAMATKIKEPTSTGTVTLDNTASVWYFNSSPSSIKFPTASTCTNRRYIIVNQSGGAITTNRYIDLSPTAVNSIADATSIEIISDGTDWLQIK